MTQYEVAVYNQLKVLADYVKVINVMNDEAKNDPLTDQMMEDAIKLYEDKSNKLSSKADSTISVLIKKLFDNENSGSGSYYSKFN